MSGEILFLSHRMPFPPDRGDKIRSHHVLRHLARLAPVHVATFADDHRDLAEEAELAAVARSYCLVERSKPLALAGVEALLRREPVSLAAFRYARIAAYVRKVLAEHPIGTIYVFSGQMGQYVPADFGGRLLVDFVDVDSAKFAAYAQRRGGPRGWIDAREACLLKDEEARVAAQAHTSLLISDEEAELFRSRLPGAQRAACDVRTLRNGVDTHFYDPTLTRPEPRMAEHDGPRLIFTGQMDYEPNVEAVVRTAERILPRIREVLPNASLNVVGRNPPASLMALADRPGVNIWGAVEDVRPWLAGSDLALVPLDIARGVQNKVLEAMAMGLPVVLTPAAASGIGGRDGLHFAVGESDADLAARTVSLLVHPNHGKAMGQEARAYLVDRMSWQAMLAPLAELIGHQPRVRRHAA